MFYKDIQIRSDPKNLTILAEVEISIKELGQSYSLENSLEITIAPCQDGSIYNLALKRCDICPENYYNYQDPMTTFSCKSCLEGMVCKGGDLTYPQEGYWRIEARSERLVKCRNQVACLEGDRTHQTGICEEGYEGNICGICSPGWGKFGTDLKCTYCRDDVSYFAKFAVLLIFEILVVLVNIRTNAKIDLSK